MWSLVSPFLAATTSDWRAKPAGRGPKIEPGRPTSVCRLFIFCHGVRRVLISRSPGQAPYGTNRRAPKTGVRQKRPTRTPGPPVVPTISDQNPSLPHGASRRPILRLYLPLCFGPKFEIVSLRKISLSLRILLQPPLKHRPSGRTPHQWKRGPRFHWCDSASFGKQHWCFDGKSICSN